MAKRGRDHLISSTPITTQRVPRLAPSFRVTPTNYAAVLAPLSVPLTEIEDRRTFHPLGRFRPPRLVNGVAAQVGLVNRGKPSVASPSLSKFNRSLRSQTKALVAFQEPDRVVMCLRRKQRREVLHAKGIAGSKMRFRAPRRTPFSEVSCRR